MFITVSVGGMLAVAATAATTGAIAGLYLRAKTAKVIGRLVSKLDTANQNTQAVNLRQGSTLGSKASPSE